MLPAPIQQELRFSKHGTRVTVNDLFGNMPVRVKSRALAFQRQEELDREWDDLKHLLVSLMLANEKFTKLVISDAGRSRKMTIRLPERLLSSDQSSVMDDYELKHVRLILSQAGIVSLDNSESWNTVSACLPDLSIHAAVSLVPSPTKKVQFISLGANPVFARNDTNALYSEVNRLFALSDFGAIDTGYSISTQNASTMEHIDNQSGAQIKGTSKATNKWPMFYIRINTTVPQKMSEGGNEESDKSVQRIIDVLSAMINEFLAQHNLRPRAVRRKRKTGETPREPDIRDRRVKQKRASAREGSSGRFNGDRPASSMEDFDRRLKLPSFHGLSQMHHSQDFTAWSRIKSAKENTSNARYPELPRARREPAVVGLPYRESKTEKTGIQSTQQAPASLSGNTEAKPTEAQGISNDTEDTMIPWTDPLTKQTVLINSRTGQTMDSRRLLSAGIARPQSTGTIWTARKLDDIRRPRSAAPRTQNIWIENMLRKWDNPAFSRSERPISSTDLETKCEDVYSQQSIGHDCSGNVFGLEAARFARSRGKLWRGGLEAAEVIAQVEQKFILAKMPTASNASGPRDDEDAGTVLVLIDQHAADERCRIEGLLESYITEEKSEGQSETMNQVQTIAVDPIYIKAEATEVVLCEKYLKYFKSWGISYTVERETKIVPKTGQIRIDSLPTLIAERCRTEPNLLADLIRGEMWKREESGEGPLPTRRNDGDDDDDPSGPKRRPWIERMRGCPQGIIDLLNSRACRSAIMFNDVLSVGECERLVRGLARCTFPFQCAHGRPSMVPILDLVGIGNGVEVDGYEDDFGEAFRAWTNLEG